MNGKTVKKRLMRGRSNVMWGSRAFLTVRLPLSLIPEPPPPRVPPDRVGEPGGLAGYWARPDTVEGRTILTVISDLHSGGDPMRDRGSDKVRMPVLHLEHESSEYDVCDDDGNVVGTKTDHRYRWWEIQEIVFENYDTPEQKRVEVRPGPADLVDIYRARRLWFSKYTQGGQTGIPVLDTFMGAAFWAKTTYEHVDEAQNALFITYSVKWFYPSRKFGFARDFSRAMKFAKKAGVPARVVRLWGMRPGGSWALPKAGCPTGDSGSTPPSSTQWIYWVPPA